MERPEDPKSVFEEQSHFVKQNKFEPNSPGVKHHIEKGNPLQEETLRKVAKLLEFEKKQLAEDEEAPEKKESGAQNISELFMVLKQSGIDFGQDQALLLQKSLNDLAFGYGAKQVRLLGKVQGRSRDLWVAEMEEVNEKDDQDLNKYTQFVNGNPTGDWQRLPDISTVHVTQAQNIKYILTGDLNRRLVTNPEFDGREKEFLRAQIARIVHSTSICPDGLFDKEEDGGGIMPKDEESKEVKGTTDLNSHESWVWVRPGILPSGLLKAKEVEENEEEEDKNKETREQTLERLQKLENDKDNWKLSIQGFNDSHKLEGRDVSQAVNVISSMRWPGSLTVAYKGSYHNFYLGWGLKAKTQPFQPICPPNIVDDPQELSEHVEPYPTQIPQEEEKKDDVVEEE